MEKMLEVKYPKKIEKDEEDKQEEKRIQDPIETTLNAIDDMKYETLSKFGWDQEDKKVKVYITSGIDGVGSIPGNQVHCEFEDQSFDLKVQGLKDKNYRLKVFL